jgi:ribose transport system ATP-binding protein
MRQAAAAALEQLGHPEISPDHPVRGLPVSAQQLVEIARALVVKSRVLVLDEPTSSLAGEDVERLFALVDRLRAQGLAVVYISHFLEEVLRVADRYTVLRDGKSVGSGRVADVRASDLVSLMIGRALTELFPRSPRAPGAVLLEIKELGAARVDSASLALRRGEVLGIAGLVGAGRTELLRALFGLDPVRRGQIKVGAYLGPASPARRLAQGVGLLSEDRKAEGLAVGMSVADNVTLSRLQGLGPAGLVLSGRQAASVRRRISELGIRCRSPWQRVVELSGGNQQKVALARLLHHDVDALLLDEPTRGIDVGSKAQIYQLIDELAVRGKAVLLVSSYLPELLGVCDRVAVMCRGRLAPARAAGELTEHALLLEATGGAAA